MVGREVLGTGARSRLAAIAGNRSRHRVKQAHARQQAKVLTHDETQRRKKGTTMLCHSLRVRADSRTLTYQREGRARVDAVEKVGGKHPIRNLRCPLLRARLHPLSFDYSPGVGRAEKIEENLRGLGILCSRHQKSMDDSGRHDA
jgi:hypothetical protein